MYDGFLGDRDRRLCEQVRRADPKRLAGENWPFDDPRLPELLFRYRARNFPETLSASEQSRWLEFCRNRLKSPEFGAPNTLANFFQALDELQAKTESTQRAVLLEWRRYATELGSRYQL
ncbi:Exodeoxyribonuclease I [compost metagenome]